MRLERGAPALLPPTAASRRATKTGVDVASASPHNEKTKKKTRKKNMSSSSTSNAASAALDALRRCPCKPERHGPGLLVWRADVTGELFGGAPSSSPSPSSSSSLGALHHLLHNCFHRRFAAPPDALPDIVASAYTPGALFDNNLATVAGTSNIAAAWRFLAAPFVSVGVVGGQGVPSRVEVVAWAPAATAVTMAAQEGGEGEAMMAQAMTAAAAAAKPPAGSFFPEEAEEPEQEQLQPQEQEQQPALPPTRPPASASVALVVETEQRWRMARALVLVRAVFGDDVRVCVTSTLRLARASGKVAAHADRVEGWWAVPRPLRAALGALAPVVTTVLGW
jgi:hypothetical protein